MKRIIVTTSLLATVIVLVFSQAQAALKSVEILTGIGWGSLNHSHQHYRTVPVVAGFDFDLKPLLAEKLSFHPKQAIEFQIEPFIAGVLQPEKNAEMGVSFALKYGLLPETSKFQPYIRVGTGMDYMTMHVDEQHIQFNFISHAGVGAHYYITKKTALTFDWRFRHLSSAGLGGSPNNGINSFQAIAGVRFDI